MWGRRGEGDNEEADRGPPPPTALDAIPRTTRANARSNGRVSAARDTVAGLDGREDSQPFGANANVNTVLSMDVGALERIAEDILRTVRHSSSVQGWTRIGRGRSAKPQTMHLG